MSASGEQLIGQEPPARPLAAPAATGKRRGTLAALVLACRPRQWTKSLLVLAAPGAAGVLGHPGPLGRTAAAFGLFVAASSGTYLLNDSRDVEADRRHPTKRHRPIASGDLSTRAALLAAAVLLVGALAGAPFVAGLGLTLTVGGYVVLTVAYSLWLKQVPFVELACISLAFLARALGGAAAAGVRVSPWFLAVASAGALLIAAGKRVAELRLLGAASAGHRRSLAAYPPWLLRGVCVASGVAVVTGYLLWALWRGAQTDDEALFVGSSVPFGLAIAYLERLIERGEGGAPEELALHSRTLQLLGAGCLAMVAIGIYT